MNLNLDEMESFQDSSDKLCKKRGILIQTHTDVLTCLQIAGIHEYEVSRKPEEKTSISKVLDKIFLNNVEICANAKFDLLNLT